MILEVLLSIFDVDSLLKSGGLLIIFLIVYGQTGLFFTFFLPSGAMLFTAGVWIATGDLNYSLFTTCAALIVAAMLGNMTGYWIGWKTGPMFYKRQDTRFFKKEYLIKASSFYHKYGGWALTGGPFFPIIRTFSPIVAGILKVTLQRFVFFTLIGSTLWIVSFVMSGYLIGIVPFLKPYLTYVILIIIVIVTVPLVIRIIRQLNKSNKTEEFEK